MPLYEYRCDEDGQTITLLRPMADADKPVEDPQGRGRTFRRALSGFSVGGATATGGSPPAGGCACGNPHGPCASHS